MSVSYRAKVVWGVKVPDSKVQTLYHNLEDKEWDEIVDFIHGDDFDDPTIVGICMSEMGEYDKIPEPFSVFDFANDCTKLTSFQNFLEALGHSSSECKNYVVLECS